jgi:hypothetical protein
MCTPDIQKVVCIRTDRHCRHSSKVAFLFESIVNVAETYTSTSMGLWCFDYIREQRRCL